MDIHINVSDHIGISEHIGVEIEIDAVIYRNEFEKYKSEYLKSKKDSDLIITFIFLQIYIECFLHHNMRHVIQFEFKPPRDNVADDWLIGERRDVREKINNFTNLFFDPVSNPIQGLVDVIKKNFTNITDIRNLFAHGHKVAKWSDSSGSSGVSPAKLFLSESQLTQSIKEINELGKAWDDLLDNVLLECRALRGVDDFKFERL